MSVPAPLGPHTPLIEAVEAYLVSRAPQKDSEHTTKAIRRDVSAMAFDLADAARVQYGELRVRHLSLANLRHAFAEFSATHARASIARAWSTWNGLASFLVAEGAMEGNPVSGIRRPKPERTTPKALRGEDTPEELMLAIGRGVTGGRDPWPQRDLAILGVLLVCGLRASELTGLAVRDVIGVRGEKRLHVRGKGNAERSIPFEDSLADVVEVYLTSRRSRFGRYAADAPLFVDVRGRAMTRDQLSYLVRQTYRRAGIYDRVPSGALAHALRHTFATRLVAQGASAVEVMQLLGHQSLTTTQRYIDAAATELRTAAASNPLYRIMGSLSPEEEADERPVST